MPINPRSNSRFLLSNPILTRDGYETYGIATKPNFLIRENLEPSEIGHEIVTPKSVGRPDRLAETIYGDPNLMWILVIFNNVEDPFNWPVNNQIVEYPIKSVVFSEL